MMSDLSVSLYELGKLVKTNKNFIQVLRQTGIAGSDRTKTVRMVHPMKMHVERYLSDKARFSYDTRLQRIIHEATIDSHVFNNACWFAVKCLEIEEGTFAGVIPEENVKQWANMLNKLVDKGWYASMAHGVKFVMPSSADTKLRFMIYSFMFFDQKIEKFISHGIHSDKDRFTVANRYVGYDIFIPEGGKPSKDWSDLII